MATLKAGYQLILTPKNGGIYNLYAPDVVETRSDNGSIITSVLIGGESYQRGRGDTFGPFPVDRDYTLTKIGEVDVAILGDATGANTAIVANWGDRPPASSVKPGSQLVCPDFAYQKWISDGAYWRPAQGRITIKSVYGLNATGGQIANISGATSGIFAIAGGCKIPSGMIIPHSRVYIQADGYKSGANATASAIVYIGSTNSSSDSYVVNQTVSIANGTNFIASCAARFGTATDRFNSRLWQGEGVSAASNNSLSDRTVNVNTNADMYVNVGIASANPSDTFNLVTLQVVLEA